MSIRALIAVESCQRDRDRGFHEVIRNTWFKDICVTDKRFFMGRSFGLERGVIDENKDEVLLDVSDSYESLPRKTQRICEWALTNNFDFLFKVDTDTIVNPWTWFDPGFKYDYIGGENADTNVPGFGSNRIEFASGGAGYILSRKSLTIVADAPIMDGVQAEDVFVADALLKHGIKPTFHQGYRWHPGAVIDKDVVSLHLSSALQKKYEPSMMQEAYQRIRGQYEL